jgi:hypothetical protein
MSGTSADLENLHRRWNAAALQRELRRRAQSGVSVHPADVEPGPLLQSGEILGLPGTVEALRQAWGELIRLGLLEVTPHPAGGSVWRLVDLPVAPAVRRPA